MNSLWNHYDTIMKSLWIHYLLRDLTMNALSAFRIYLQSTIFVWYKYECTISFAISLWNHSFFIEFPMNSLSASRFLFELTIYFANSLFFREFSMNLRSASRKLFELTICFKNSPSVLRIHFESTFFVKSVIRGFRA